MSVIVPACTLPSWLEASQDAPGRSSPIGSQGVGPRRQGRRKPNGDFPVDQLIDGAALAGFLVARHPANTAYHVAARIGASPDTVANWLGGRAMPSWPYATALLCAYGPELMRACLKARLPWLDEAVAWERQRALEARKAELEQELEALESRG